VSAGFRAPAWAWVLTAAAVALFLSLAAWQLRRGLARQELQRAFAETSAPAQVLSARSAPPAGLDLQRARASGRYRADRQLLQGQSRRAQPGYQVWTPLELADGALVIVDRGWIAREAPPAAPPAGEVAVTGFWRALPEPALRLGAPGACPADPRFPAVVVYPERAELECLLGPRVVAGLLLLDAAAPGGFVREWGDFGFPPERHFGYAVQWGALALAALVIFVAINRKRPP
jgi:surfeit locus 1 family protein